MGFWHAYMGIEGGGFTDTADVVVTTRLTLYGTSQKPLTLMGSTP